MNLDKNYKAKILLIVVLGMFILSIITSISIYSVYQYKFEQSLSSSTKVATLFEGTFKNIIKDLKYFKSIDFSNNSTESLSDFKKISLLIYAHNKNINAISLIKQFDTTDYEVITNKLSLQTSITELNVRPITEIIKNSKKSKSSFSSVILHSEPVTNSKNSIGIELASEDNRHNTILQMHNSNSYTVTNPVQLVHKYKKSTTNSILFYPLHKNENDNFYTWYVAAPFTYKKILDNIIIRNSKFNNLHIELIDSEQNSIICVYKEQKDNSILNQMTLILENKVDIGNRQFILKISTDSIWSVNTYWKNILGFVSGILFLFFIAYYLFYKEQKNIEITKLKFRLSEAQKISSSGHLIWKKENGISSCSEGLVNILELNEVTINTKQLFNLIFKKDRHKIIKHFKTNTSMQLDNITFRMLINNNIKWLTIQYRVFYNNNELVEVFVVAQDITSFKVQELTLKQNTEELKKIAITDYLTGAHNRVYFDKKIKESLNNYARYGHVFSMLLLDIDHFKSINDTFGHTEGDIVLEKFSELIKSQLRDTDIFARWGGEEFSILIPYVHNKNASFVAEKLRVIIEEFEFSDKYKITCSIGVTDIKQDDNTVSLFNRVDKALYLAKNNGRNRVEFS